jgi:NRPS condensation-like uncharacterized protein
MNIKKGRRKAFSVTAGDIGMYYGRAMADQQITFAIEFAGKLNLQRLTDSLALLYQTLPILKTVLHIKGSKFSRIWAEKVEITPQIVNNPSNLHDTVLRFVSDPTDPLTEQPLKLLLISGENEDALYVKIDHVLTDAGGFKFLLYALAEAYSKGKIELPINYRRGFGQIYQRVSPLVFFKEIIRTKPSQPGPVLVKGPFELGPHFIERTVLTADKLERLRQNGKLYQATINDLLLAALYRSVFHNTGVKAGTAYPVVVPVDMRRYLPENRRGCIANLISYIHASLDKVADEPFIGTLQRVKNCMDQYKQQHPGLGTTFFMILASLNGRKSLQKDYQREHSGGPSSINLSNTGPINDELLQFSPLSVKDAYIIGPILYAPEVIIAVSSFRDKLNLIVQGNDSQRFQPFVKNLLQSMLVELETFMSGRR